MDSFFVSTGIVALAEIGDKTQLLSFVLAAKYRKPLPIILGILVATLINHAFAGLIGTWITELLSPVALRWVIGLLFLAMAVWVLIPDRFEVKDARLVSLGVFGTALIAFFFAEMGDKTQVATVMLTAHFHAFILVVLGTTLGMMLANVPVVFLGDKLAHRLPMRAVHVVAALAFAVLGILALI
ncbi:MAG: TMEM165/GDT1 family protein [Burkholderiales bacterium]|nr:TMEM165/GDT1 family protein [Burkholderiales bacterium]